MSRVHVGKARRLAPVGGSTLAGSWPYSQGWKGLPWTNNLAYFSSYKSMNKNCYETGCIIKLFTAIVNSITLKASLFVKASKEWLIMAKALAYCTTKYITAVKRFMIQAPDDDILKLFTTLIFCHSTVILSFRVMKHYFHGNYWGMAVNYCWIGLLCRI